MATRRRDTTNSRVEAWPGLVALGALLLLVSLFLDWYEPGVTAWTAFEAWDLILAALAVAALVASAGLLAPELAYVDRAWLAPAAAAPLIIVVAEMLNPPPAVDGAAPELGAWLALASTLLMAAGAILTFGRVHFAVEVERRDPRRRVQAVDSRRDRTSDSPAVPSPAAESRRAEGTGVPEAGEPDEPPAERRRGRSWLQREADEAAAEPAAGEDPEQRPGAGRG